MQLHTPRLCRVTHTVQRCSLAHACATAACGSPNAVQCKTKQGDPTMMGSLPRGPGAMCRALLTLPPIGPL